jgi:hypothetical protein
MTTVLTPDTVIAIDLDRTLADGSVVDVNNYRSDLIGNPIALNVERVKAWLAAGRKVVIFTARVHPRHGLAEVVIAEKAIKEWCVNVFGRELEVTCMKDPLFCEIWDDKAVRVIPETGVISNQTEVNDPLVQHNPDPIGSFFD